MLQETTIIKKQQRKPKVQRRKPKAEELFEPEELQRGYLTELDVTIRKNDKPERFQVRFQRNKKIDFKKKISSATTYSNC